MLSDEQVLELVRENEQMKTALKAIRTYASCAIFGAWRQYIYDLSNTALKGR